jgi:hypothetical protein
LGLTHSFVTTGKQLSIEKGSPQEGRYPVQVVSFSTISTSDNASTNPATTTAAATCAEKNYSGGMTMEYGVIGLLDIFVFESFVRNRFEQLCINHCNEKLLAKFTEDIFRSVQEEGIPLDEIKYDDNNNVLDLIEGKTGLLAMFNKECVRPKGSDATFVSKALATNSHTTTNRNN